MTLDDAIQMALKNNLELEIEKTNIEAAHNAIQAAKGAFDPYVRLQSAFENRNTPAASVLQGSSGKLNEKFFNNTAGLRQKVFSNGGSYTADFDAARQTSTNPFTSLNPLTSSRLSFGYMQPLLRNRKIDRERAELLIRNKQAGVSQIEFELRVVDVINRVEQAYWDLTGARQDVAVKTDAVKLAQEQLDRNKRMIDSGTLAPIELSASQSELDRRKDTRLASVGVVTELENQLKTLLVGDKGAEIWGQEIIPSETAMVSPPEWKELSLALAKALAQRPELKQLAERLAISTIEMEANREQTKAQVNLFGNYSFSGLAGSLRPGENPFSASNIPLYDRLNKLSALAGLPAFVPPSGGSLPDFLIGGYGSTLGNLFSGRYQTVQAGLSIDINLRNRASQAAVAQSAINERKLKLERARTEQAIAVQVRNALQSLETARERIVASESSANAAQEKLESELRLFQTGESTNFFVLTRQNEFLDSRRREVLARLDFNKAAARLESAIGQTLENRKIRIK